MKIMHISFDDSGGGAAIAANRLHTGLRACSVDSHMAVAVKNGDSAHVHLLWSKFHQRVGQPIYNRIEKLPLQLLYNRPDHPAYINFSWLPTARHRSINAMGHDVTHLHWIADGYISPHALARLHQPTVWTIHDTWPFTGGCHFTATNCTRYHGHCGQCPELCSEQQWDISRAHWILKRKAIERLRPIIVAPSRAYAQQAKQSGMLGDCRIEHIPHGIDITIFKPINQAQARLILGLPAATKLILIGGFDATKDYNKGFDLVEQALSHVQNTCKTPFEILVFGASQTQKPTPHTMHFLGKLHDAVTLALAYSAADIFVCPSRQESFSLTTLEALACGTPVIAFPVGGIPDMVAHQKNGYLAKPYDPEDMAKGISLLLKNDELRKKWGTLGREKVEKEFSLPIIVEKYKQLYQSVLNK